MKGESGRRRYITMKELQEVWSDAQQRGILYNGMTFALLREKFHRNIYHNGHFFYYPNSPESNQ